MQMQIKGICRVGNQLHIGCAMDLYLEKVISLNPEQNVSNFQQHAAEVRSAAPMLIRRECIAEEVTRQIVNTVVKCSFFCLMFLRLDTMSIT